MEGSGLFDGSDVFWALGLGGQGLGAPRGGCGIGGAWTETDGISLL